MKRILLLCIVLLLFACSREEPFDKAILSFRFDDAFKSQTSAMKFLSRHGMKGTLYCITRSLGTCGYMTWGDIKTLQKEGHEIGSHSVSHPRLPFLWKKSHQYEISHSRLILQKQGLHITTFAYPYGMHNPLFMNQVRRYYKCASTYDILFTAAFNNRHTDSAFLNCRSPETAADFKEYLNYAIRKKLWFVACFHRFEGKKSFSIPLYEFKKMVRYTVQCMKTGKITVMTLNQGCSQLQQPATVR